MWNCKNIFTGWVDVPLSRNGIEEAKAAGRSLATLEFDVAFVSTLIRSQLTLFIALSENDSPKTPLLIHDSGREAEWGAIYGEQEVIPVRVAWQLNERMYGELQGHNKDEARARHGAEQVHEWRRSYDIAPPHGESLEMTAARTLPYFQEKIVPLLRDGKRILVSAHGNSLRAIVMHIEALSSSDIVSREIPTGEPFGYTYSEGAFTKWEGAL